MTRALASASLMILAAVSFHLPWQAANAASPPPKISSFSPHKGAVGSTVTILGSNFVILEGVTFGGGVAAAGSFTSTRISVTVPAGATNGDIQVTTAGGSASTNKPFRVTRARAIQTPPGLLAGPITGRNTR